MTQPRPRIGMYGLIQRRLDDIEARLDAHHRIYLQKPDVITEKQLDEFLGVLLGVGRRITALEGAVSASDTQALGERITALESAFQKLLLRLDGATLPRDGTLGKGLGERVTALESSYQKLALITESSFQKFALIMEAASPSDEEAADSHALSGGVFNVDGIKGTPLYQMAVKQASRFYMGMKDMHAQMTTLREEMKIMAASVLSNTAKTGITSEQARAITQNTAKTGITSDQARAITENTALGGGKSITGITSEQVRAITHNT